MPSKRRPVQQAHERFTIGLFLDTFNRRYHSGFRVVAEPNPPEAIIQSNRTTRWVEVTTAFWSKAFAIDVYSYATEGEEHRPIGNGVFVGPDAKFSANFASVLKQKLEKQTYAPFHQKYGKGYLVVAIQYPLFNERTFHYMRREWSATTVNDRGYFRSIYLTYRAFNGYTVSRWRTK